MDEEFTLINKIDFQEKGIKGETSQKRNFIWSQIRWLNMYICIDITLNKIWNLYIAYATPALPINFFRRDGETIL